MEEERGLDRAAAMADMRFSFIEKLVSSTVIKPEESKERERSEKMDKILTGKHTAIPAFAIIKSVPFIPARLNVLVTEIADTVISDTSFDNDAVRKCFLYTKSE